MEFFRIRRDIPFMRHALIFNVISFLTFAAAVFFLATRGLHLSIEFTGGTVIEAAYTQAADIGKVRATVESLNLGEVQVQNFGTPRDVLIRLPVRGFAVVHCLGIVTSMFSSVVFSRGLVNLWYGGKKKLKSVSIGQIWRPEGAAKPAAEA